MKRLPRRLALRGLTTPEMFDMLHYYEHDAQFQAQEAIVAFVKGFADEGAGLGQ